MKTVNVGGLLFGEGPPKICIALTGSGVPALLAEISKVSALPADLYEWRADHFFGELTPALDILRKEIKRPLLCTLRTASEGGCADISPEKYEKALCALIEHGGFEFIDIELSAGEERVSRLVRKAKALGLGVVISKHDFEKTPPKDEIVATLGKMAELGADLPKYAVMPQSASDVLTLLSATLEAHEKVGAVITMAMGSLGKLSRVSGELFGSCMTFGTGESSSAPGQLDAEKLKAILEELSPAGSR